MLKIKKLHIDSGSTPICIMHARDAGLIGIHPTEKIIIKSKNKKSIVTKVDIQSINGNIVKQGEIGVSTNVLNILKIKDKSYVDIEPLGNIKSFEAIHKKFELNKEYTQSDMDEIIKDLVNHKLSEIQTTFFITTNALRGLSIKETIYLAKAMANSGNIITPDMYKSKNNDINIICDKHCIGGIPGNRTTPIVISIVAACGYTVANTFTRSITSPAGTADVLETYLNVTLSTKQMIETVKKVGACLVWGGGLDINPADDLIIRIEHPIDIDSEEQIVASILSKKKAVGNTHLILDIPYGKMAKVDTIQKAKKLGNKFIQVAKALNINIKVVYTEGSNPIGYGVGPVLEMIDVLNVLKNNEKAPQDLKNKAIFLASELLELVDKNKKEKKYYINKAKEALESGKAYQKFEEIRKAQGIKNDVKLAKYFKDIKAEKSGKLIEIKNKFITKICKEAGAPLDHAAGIFFYKKNNDIIKKGDLIYRIYSNSADKLEKAALLAENIKDEIIIK